MYKTLGEFSLKHQMNSSPQLGVCMVDSEEDEPGEPLISTIGHAVGSFHASLTCLKEIFSTEIYRGIFGFITWWTCLIWFSSTSLGMFYQTYFTRKI